MTNGGPASSPQSSKHIDLPDIPITVERVCVIDPTDGTRIEYEGSFAFRRDGGSFEVSVLVGTEPVTGSQPIEAGPLVDRPIESLPEREGSLIDEALKHILVATTGKWVIASGPITAVGVIDGTVGIAAAAPTSMAPNEARRAASEPIREGAAPAET